MKRGRDEMSQRGFTLIELLTALGIFLLICGAAFTLLGTSQKRYRTESEVLSSFQDARLGLDQIVRDINDAGYPPPIFNTGRPALVASTPFAWYPGYTTSNPCAVTAGCITPGDIDLIIETNPNPQDPGSTVQWIRYQLQGTTLMRGMAPKVSGDSPALDTAAVLAPFVQNVVNNASPAQIAQYQAAYPGMFPGGIPVPIFTYTCDTPTAQPPPQQLPLCGGALADNSPENIRDVTVRLIIAAPLPDATTGRPRLVMLKGRGRRINPNQYQ